MHKVPHAPRLAPPRLAPPRLAPPRLAAALAVLAVLAAASAAAQTAAVGSVTGLALPRFVSLKADRVHARVGPSRDHAIRWVFVRKGLPVEVTAEFDRWRRIRDMDGDAGWVHQSLLDGRRHGLVRGPGAVALRSGPAADAPVRARLAPGVVGRLQACRDAWCRLALPAGRGWVARARLWGVYAGETLP